MDISLKQVIKKAGIAIDQWCDTLDRTIQIQDACGLILKGQAPIDTTFTYPVLLGETPIGWVSGAPSAAIVAQFLTYLSERELETRKLAHEVLDHYREINLLYNLSEKLGASLDLAVVVQTVLTEARRLIPATAASIVLLHPATNSFESSLIFSQNDADHNHQGCISDDLVQAQTGIAETVVQTGKGELVNDWNNDRRCCAALKSIRSLVCVPMKTDKRVIGVITIIHQESADYTAQHLKLLTTVASQASQAIVNAQLHQQQLEEARTREEKLQQQLHELQLEVDHIKRARQVAEITETEYFQQLQQRAKRLREQRRQGGCL